MRKRKQNDASQNVRLDSRLLVPSYLQDDCLTLEWVQSMVQWQLVIIMRLVGSRSLQSFGEDGLLLRKMQHDIQ